MVTSHQLLFHLPAHLFSRGSSHFVLGAFFLVLHFLFSASLHSFSFLSASFFVTSELFLFLLSFFPTFMLLIYSVYYLFFLADSLFLPSLCLLSTASCSSSLSRRLISSTQQGRTRRLNSGTLTSLSTSRRWRWHVSPYSRYLRSSGLARGPHLICQLWTRFEPKTRYGAIADLRVITCVQLLAVEWWFAFERRFIGRM